MNLSFQETCIIYPELIRYKHINTWKSKDAVEKILDRPFYYNSSCYIKTSNWFTYSDSGSTFSFKTIQLDEIETPGNPVQIHKDMINDVFHSLRRLDTTIPKMELELSNMKWYHLFSKLEMKRAIRGMEIVKINLELSIKKLT